MERQSRAAGLKRPEGVKTLRRGGRIGYSFGNNSEPWYSPPAYGGCLQRSTKRHSRMFDSSGCAWMPGGGLAISRRNSFNNRLCAERVDDFPSSLMVGRSRGATGARAVVLSTNTTWS